LEEFFGWEMAIAKRAVGNAQNVYFQGRRGIWSSRNHFPGTRDEFPGTLDEFPGTLDEFPGALDEFPGALDEFQGALDEFQRALDEFQGALDEFQGALDEFQGALDEFQGALDKVQGALDEVQGALDEVQGALDEVRARWTTSRARWTSSRARWMSSRARVTSSRARWMASMVPWTAVSMTRRSRSKIFRQSFRRGFRQRKAQRGGNKPRAVSLVLSMGSVSLLILKTGVGPIGRFQNSCLIELDVRLSFFSENASGWRRIGRKGIGIWIEKYLETGETIFSANPGCPAGRKFCRTPFCLPSGEAFVLLFIHWL
jgi:hypothetical protein